MPIERVWKIAGWIYGWMDGRLHGLMDDRRKDRWMCEPSLIAVIVVISWWVIGVLCLTPCSPKPPAPTLQPPWDRGYYRELSVSEVPSDPESLVIKQQFPPLLLCNPAVVLHLFYSPGTSPFFLSFGFVKKENTAEEKQRKRDDCLRNVSFVRHCKPCLWYTDRQANLLSVSSTHCVYRTLDRSEEHTSELQSR